MIRIISVADHLKHYVVEHELTTAQITKWEMRPLYYSSGNSISIIYDVELRQDAMDALLKIFKPDEISRQAHYLFEFSMQGVRNKERRVAEAKEQALVNADELMEARKEKFIYNLNERVKKFTDYHNQKTADDVVNWLGNVNNYELEPENKTKLQAFFEKESELRKQLAELRQERANFEKQLKQEFLEEQGYVLKGYDLTPLKERIIEKSSRSGLDLLLS